MSVEDSPADSSGPVTVDGDVGYDPTSDTYHTHFDPRGHSDEVVVAIVKTIGAITGNDPATLPPLFETIHTGALTKLVSSDRNRAIEVQFEYADHHVTITTGGDLVVSAAETE